MRVKLYLFKPYFDQFNPLISHFIEIYYHIANTTVILEPIKQSNMHKNIRIGLYRVLRKMGAKRDEICLNAKLTNLIDFDDQEWLCFYFFLESKFNFNLTREEEKRLQTVASTLNVIENKLGIHATPTVNIQAKQVAMVS